MEAPVQARANLAYSFQEPLTAILRVQEQRASVQDSESFRAQIRRALQHSMQEARNLGYSNELIQMAVFAVVALLDESVLNLQNPVFSDWSRRPLQEELFGGHTAGEVFFRNLDVLLGKQDGKDVADCLEVYCLCLLLGYKGRYALNGSGDLQAYLRRAREKMARARGKAVLFESVAVPEVKPSTGPDRWTGTLGIAAAALLALTLLSFGVMEFSLASGAAQVQNSSGNAH